MDKDERIQYLATLNKLIRTDKVVMDIEKRVYDELAKDIGATREERIKAKDIAKEKGFRIKYPSRLSDRIRTFEDILFVAYADGEYSSAEKMLYTKYAVKLGVTRKHTRVIKADLNKRLRKLNLKELGDLSL